MAGHKYGSLVIGEVRSESGRQGRGMSALSSKEARSWKAMQMRIDAIVARAERGGGMSRPRLLKLPIKGVLRWKV